MGLFEILFKGPNEGKWPFTKTAEMLDEDLFWKIVDESLRIAYDQKGQTHYLINALQKLSGTEIIGFRLRTDKLLYDTYNDRMWCAGCIMNKGYCSDDGFDYFRYWIISRGRKVYYSALSDPDTLVGQINSNLKFYDFESFSYVAAQAFEAKTGRRIYPFIDYDNFLFSERYYPEINFSWDGQNPETMKAICPSLFAAMLD